MNRRIVTDDLKGISLSGVEDILECGLFRKAHKSIATLWSAHALNHIPFAEALEDLLGILKIQSLTLSDLGGADS
jgi:hypothetical protein